MITYIYLHQFRLRQVLCLVYPNVPSLSFLIALSIFSNVYSLLIITLCWSFVDDMNSLFAFQNKYAIQNAVLKIIDAKRYTLMSNSP